MATSLAVPLVGLPLLAHADATSVHVGIVNHDNKPGLGLKINGHSDSASVTFAADKSKDQVHAIIGVGKSFDNSYVYATTSYAKEKHYGTELTGIGGSVGGLYATPTVKIDGNIIAHKAHDKHIDKKSDTQSATDVKTVGNQEITTTTKTTTITHRDFDGKTRIGLNFGGTFDVGQHDTVRIGGTHNFDTHKTNADLLYSHYFHDDTSAIYLGANTDKDFKAGIKHHFDKSNWSVRAGVFSDNLDNKRNNGGHIGVTYTFGGNRHAPKLHTPETYDPAVLMHARLDGLNTTSADAIKGIHQLGDLRTKTSTTQSSSEQRKTLDTLTAFVAPTVIVEGNSIRVANHGILDLDGLENIQYTLTTAGGTTITNNTGIFKGLNDGTYTITTSAEAKIGNTKDFIPASNTE